MKPGAVVLALLAAVFLTASSSRALAYSSTGNLRRLEHLTPTTWPQVREAVSICQAAAEELDVRLAEAFYVYSYDGQSVLIDGDYCKRPVAIVGSVHRRTALVHNRTGTAACLAAQGFGCGSFFTVQNRATVRIANFSLSGGFSPPEGWDGYGGAIWVEQSTLILTSSSVADSVAWRGGGIYSRWSNLTISAVRFANNSASPSGDGGAISADWCRLRTTDTSFEGNRAVGSGAAVSVSSSGRTTVTTARFEDNRCGTGMGCAISQIGQGLVRCQSEHTALSLSRTDYNVVQ